MADALNILVLFTREDNENNAGSGLEWVSSFKMFFEKTAHQVMGKIPNVLLKDDTSDATPSELESADFFIFIVSPSFIRSKKCMETLGHIESSYLSRKKGRGFKVIKEGVPLSKQSPSLRKLPEYNMGSVGLAIKSDVDFFSLRSKQQYWPEMLGLVFEIQQSTDGGNQLIFKHLLKHRTVFLAATDQELLLQRNIIKRELQRYGCNVLPNAPLPAAQDQWKEAVKNDLERSDFSIHLIGGIRDKVLEGTNQSIGAIQNHLAAERSIGGEKKSFCRLIWISPAVKTTKDELQKSFVETIRRNLDIRDHKTEISEAPFEDFKKMLREKLLQENNKNAPPPPSERKIAYLIYTIEDQKDVQPYLKTIEKVGFDVVMPAFTGEFAEVRKQHIKNLSVFDVAIIFTSQVNDTWVQVKALDILKSPGIGRNKPILGKIFVAPGYNTDQLQKIKDYGIELIGADHKKPMEALENLLGKLKSR